VQVEGHLGEITHLLIGAGVVITASLDHSVRVWGFDTASAKHLEQMSQEHSTNRCIARPQTMLVHMAPVTALCWLSSGAGLRPLHVQMHRFSTSAPWCCSDLDMYNASLFDVCTLVVLFGSDTGTGLALHLNSMFSVWQLTQLGRRCACIVCSAMHTCTMLDPVHELQSRTS
jgi:hypothetical protein